MAELRITANRRWLLENIDKGTVYLGGLGTDYYAPGPTTVSGRLRVTSGVRELIRHGLAVRAVWPGEKPTLTDAGRTAMFPPLTGLRRHILTDIAAGRVTLWVAPNGDRVAYRCDGQTVTSSVAFLISVDLVLPPSAIESGRRPSVTDRGRALLDGGDPS